MSSDYKYVLSVLQILGGRLQFRFDCGWGLTTVSVHSILVNDGQWHLAELEVKGNYARLILDQLHSASGTAPGPLHCSNLGNQVVLGGHADLLSARLKRSLPVSDGMQGCMDSVEFNGQRLSLDSDGLLGASIENMVGVFPGCVFSSPDCSSNPCLNGGSCLKRQGGGKLGPIRIHGYHHFFVIQKKIKWVFYRINVSKCLSLQDIRYCKCHFYGSQNLKIDILLKVASVNATLYSLGLILRSKSVFVTPTPACMEEPVFKIT